jgi:hypothetical protein
MVCYKFSDFLAQPVNLKKNSFLILHTYKNRISLFKKKSTINTKHFDAT